MDNPKRIIKLNERTGNYEQVDIYPDESIEVIRTFENAIYAHKWSKTYGFPIIAEPETERKAPTVIPAQAPETPAQTPPKKEFWYDKL